MSDSVQAVLMCGGLGTRLRPWSYVIPKPMFPIGERPILELLLTRLHKHAIDEIYLALGYKAELIETYFRDGAQLGVRLHYVRESEPLGTAGALNLLRDQLRAPFLMMNGDLLTRLDFRAFYTFHLAQGAAITVGVKAYEVPIPYGVVESEAHVVTALREKPTLSVNINAGIYAISPEALALMPAVGRYDATQLIEAAMNAKLRVCSYPIQEYWMDIGRFEDYHKANEDASAWLEEE
ncbi:MAG: sugar phosphate nucleotidyltransferase [Aggregatilineales bacterium]